MRKTLAIASAAVVLATACSDAPSEGDRSLLAETPGSQKIQGDKGGKGSGKKAAPKPGNGPAAVATDGPAAPGPGAIQGNVDVPGADEQQQYPSAFAEVAEPEADAKSQGITPDYAEITRVSVEGLGRQFRVTLNFGGDLPQQMPNDKTIMVVGFQMLRGEDEGYAFAGQATNKGWKPYAGGKDKQTDFPGSFEVTGDQIVMTIPWSYPDGAYPFKWLVSSNWFQSLANTTHYKFDIVPNKDQANYPG